jgi:hypothetical protein
VAVQMHLLPKAHDPPRPALLRNRVPAVPTIQALSLHSNSLLLAAGPNPGQDSAH